MSLFLWVTQWNKDEVNKIIAFLQLVGLLFVKDDKIESQEKVKDKSDIGVVLWVTNIYHYSTKSTFEVSLIIYGSSLTQFCKLPLKLTDLLWSSVTVIKFNRPAVIKCYCDQISENLTKFVTVHFLRVTQ